MSGSFDHCDRRKIEKIVKIAVAQYRIETEDPLVQCRSCGASIEPTSWTFRCPRCEHM